jgi:hypothetical protein
MRNERDPVIASIYARLRLVASTRKSARLCLAILWASTGIASAQNYLIDPLFSVGPGKGVELLGASVYWSRNWLDLPPASLSLLGPGIAQSNSVGISAAVGYSRSKPTSSFFIRYAPSGQYSSVYGWNSVSHSASLSYAKSLSPNLTWMVGGQGFAGNYDQFLFQPSQASVLTSSGLTFADLSGAFLDGSYSSQDIASLISGSSAIDSSAQRYFYGTRFWSAGLTTSVAYTYSPRLTLSASATAHRNQRLTDRTDLAGNPSSLLYRSTASYGNLSANYSLTAKTTLGLSLNGGNAITDYDSVYNASTILSVGHRWNRVFARIHAGAVDQWVAYSSFSNTQSQPSAAFGGSLGIATLAHTVIGTYNRTVGNSYGIPDQFSESASLAWNWAPLTQKWGAQAGISAHHISYPSGNFWGYRGYAGFGRALGRGTAMQVQYVYDTNRGSPFQNSYLPIAVGNLQGLRVGLSWSPRQGSSVGGEAIPDGAQ